MTFQELTIFVAGLLGGFLLGVLFRALSISVVESIKDARIKRLYETKKQTK